MNRKDHKDVLKAFGIEQPEAFAPMTGDPKCPACGFEWVKSAPNPVSHVCTGRPGCVRTAPVPPVPATSGVDSGATPIMPDGWEQNAQPTDTLLLALSMGMKVGPAVAQQAADEIARLRAEVERLNGDALAGADPFENGWEPGNDIRLYRSRIKELMAENERLTRQVDRWIDCARATETHAARLEDRHADLAARAADLTLKAQAVAKADRAAITAALKETPDA